jgi:hypothetical protein
MWRKGIFRQLASPQKYTLLLLLLFIDAGLVFGLVAAPMVLRCQLSVFVAGGAVLLACVPITQNSCSRKPSGIQELVTR